MYNFILKLGVILEAVIVHTTRTIAIDCYVKSTQKIEKTKKKIFFNKFFSDFAISQNKPTSNVGWKVLLHPLYSSDLPLSGYHLFRSMQNVLTEIKFNSVQDIKNWLHAFLAAQPPQFYWDRIHKLPDRSTNVAASDGLYFEWDVISFSYLNKPLFFTKKSRFLIPTPNIYRWKIERKYLTNKALIFEIV